MSDESDEDSMQRSFDDDDEDSTNELTPADSYPKCSDDEARICLYPVDVAGIPTLPMCALTGDYVSIDKPGPNLSLGEAILDILRFALPDWIIDSDPCPEPHLLPEQSKARLDCIELDYDSLSWPEISNEDGFSASLPRGLPFDLALHRALSLSFSTRCQRATEGEKGVLLTPSLIWTPVYDTIFEYIERDVLRDVGVAVSFRPRWSTYPSQTHRDERPVIIPDVVFSVPIPGAESSRSAFTERAHRYHPAHDFDDAHSPVLDVPLLLVEYNKCWGSSGELGFVPHSYHLYATMAAALALYDALGLKTPVLGLLVVAVDELSLFAGVIEYGRPMIRQISVANYRSEFDATNSIQMLHLYTVLANLQTLSAKVSLHLKGLLDVKEADLSPLMYKSPIKGVPVERRRYIDRAHPPLIIDDPLLQFLFVSSPPRIADWLRRGQMTLVARPTSITNLPSQVREWLCLFTTASPVSSTVLQGAVEDCKKGMPCRVHALVDTFWSEHGAHPIGRGAPNDDKKQFRYISDNLMYSLSACARARDLLHRPLNRGHSLTNSWLTLYRTLFTEAVEFCEELRLRYNHAWAVHRCLRLEASTLSELDTLNLDEIRPEMVFVMPVKSICWRCGMAWKEHCESAGWDHTHRVFADLCVWTDAEAVTLELSPVDMPIFVVEYVLTPNEREKHVAHLAISMRSALAIWEMHQLAATAAVLGFLLDRNMVNVFVGWMDKNECIIQELLDADFTFDITKPLDAYRLCAMLTLQGSETFFHHVNAVINAHVNEAVEAVFREDYHSWKEPKRNPSSVFNLEKPVEGRRNIESWLAGVDTPKSQTVNSPVS